MDDIRYGRTARCARWALMATLGLCACGSDDSAAYGDDGGDGYGVGAGDEAGEPYEPPPPPPPEDVTPENASCDADEPVSLFLSPDDSNSMSSPVQAREAVLDGFSAIAGVPIRAWEFMNYYTFDYPAAAPGEVVVTPSLLVPPGAEEGEYYLQIAVTSEQIAPADRAPMSITLVLDTSGSMQGHSMDMLKATSRAIAGSLREGDTVSMVTWDTDNQIVLGGYAVQGPDDALLLEHIESLQAGGGTDLHGGLTAGYELATEVHRPGLVSRVVLVSDGGANAGVTSIDVIAEHAGANDGDGIYMVGVGVGDGGTYHDALMNQVTDAGKGASVFINDIAEAERMFGTDFISTLSVAVRDVQVRVDMPPGFEVVRFSGEEISENPEEVEPQHLAHNDSMVFFQEIHTCAPQLVNDESQVTIAVRYLDGTTFEAGEEVVEVDFGDLLDRRDRQLLKGAAVFAYAEALQAVSGQANDQALLRDDALEALGIAEEANPGDPELAEIRSVLSAL